MTSGSASVMASLEMAVSPTQRHTPGSPPGAEGLLVRPASASKLRTPASAQTAFRMTLRVACVTKVMVW